MNNKTIMKQLDKIYVDAYGRLIGRMKYIPYTSFIISGLSMNMVILPIYLRTKSYTDLAVDEYEKHITFIK
jgi:hypothetical protein